MHKVCAGPFDTRSEASLVLFLRRKTEDRAVRLVSFTVSYLILDLHEPLSIDQWFRNERRKHVNGEKKRRRDSTGN